MNNLQAEEEVPLLCLLPLLQSLVRLADTHKEYGLTKSQAIVMITLKYRESITMSEAAQYISSSKEQATRAVAALCDRGLVERFEQPQNRTHVFIRFTEEGSRFMEEFGNRLREQISSRLSAKLSAEEIDTLRASLKTAVGLLNKVAG